MSGKRLIMLWVLMLIGIGTARAETTDWGPWTVPPAQRPPQNEESSFLDLAVRNFQKYISPVDGARCPMYPTCSAYARQALHKHGPLLGIFLTADRLIHEGDPLEHGEPIRKWGFTRFYDPLSHNDFWLTSSPPPNAP